MRIEGIHHVQITIPNGAETQARQFYCNILGLEEVEKPFSLRDRGGFWLALGDQQIHVGTEDGIDRSKTKAHLAHQVTNLKAWRKGLSENGIPMKESIPIPGYDRFEIRDPFGNRVEFIQKR